MPEPQRQKSPAKPHAKALARALPRLGRPPKGKTLISEERLLKSALVIVDEGGVEALSMRALAERLGVTAMSLYRYCDGHEALLDAVHQRLVTEHLPRVISPEQSYREVLTETAKAIRRSIETHPKAATLFATRAALLSARRRDVLSRLQAAGFSDSIAENLLDAVVAFTLGLSLAHYATPRASAPSDDRDTPFIVGLLAVIDGFSSRYKKGVR